MYFYSTLQEFKFKLVHEYSIVYKFILKDKEILF